MILIHDNNVFKTHQSVPVCKGSDEVGRVIIMGGRLPLMVRAQMDSSPLGYQPARCKYSNTHIMVAFSHRWRATSADRWRACGLLDVSDGSRTCMPGTVKGEGGGVSARGAAPAPSVTRSPPCGPSSQVSRHQRYLLSRLRPVCVARRKGRGAR